MALIGRHNIAKMKSSTVGTGTLTLTSAVSGFNTFANAGVQTGEVVTYTIRDGTQSEVGSGTFTLVGLTLSRDAVYSSTNAGAKIVCSGRQVVAITVAAEDIQPFASLFSNVADTIANGVNDSTLNIDSETIDQFDLVTIAADTVTITKKGRYVFWMDIYFTGAAPFNGRAKATFDGYIFKHQGYSTADGIQEDHIFIGPLLYNVPADATGYQFQFSNNTGTSLDVTIYEFSVLKLGGTS